MLYYQTLRIVYPRYAKDSVRRVASQQKKVRMVYFVEPLLVS